MRAGTRTRATHTHTRTRTRPRPRARAGAGAGAGDGAGADDTDDAHIGTGHKHTQKHTQPGAGACVHGRTWAPSNSLSHLLAKRLCSKLRRLRAGEGEGDRLAVALACRFLSLRLAKEGRKVCSGRCQFLCRRILDVKTSPVTALLELRLENPKRKTYQRSHAARPAAPPQIPHPRTLNLGTHPQRSVSLLTGMP